MGFALVGLLSCTGGEGEQREAVAPGVKPPPSARVALQPLRSLVGEALRAELDIGGLVIDFGTADQHKSTRGGWATGWGEPSGAAGMTSCSVVAAGARLDVVSASAIAEVVLRARTGHAKQKLTLSVDGAVVGAATLTAGDWQLVRIPVTATIDAGVHELGLAFARGTGSKVRAEVDWLWLAAVAGAEPPELGPRGAALSIGDAPRRALVAPSPRSYRFYLQVPERAALVFDYGSTADTKFTVRAKADAGAEVELFTGVSPGAWREQKIDLAAYAGKPLRLEFATTGPTGAAGWGEPEIMVAGAPRPRPPARTAKPRNVIFIMMDTARADGFAPSGSDRARTPAFDALAKDSTTFVNAYNNENWTKPSVATMLTGFYPSTHDTRHDASKLPVEVELLSQHLQRAGLKTAGLIANGYISKHFGFGKGWDFYRNYIRESRPSEAEHVYGDALAWLEDNRDQPFFLYIQTIDPHVPYAVGREYTKPYFADTYAGVLGADIDAREARSMSTGKIKPTEADIAWLRAVFYGEMTYHDEHMGRFLDQVERWGLLDSTLVVVNNDHGEELYEFGKVGHGHSLREHMVKAPLLMRFPGIFPAGARVEEVVEQVDLTPTIIDALGGKPLDEVDGSSLLPLLAGRPHRRPYYAIVEFLAKWRAVRVGDWKLVQNSEDVRQLYNVADDPEDSRDVAATSPIAVRMCEVYLGEGLGMPVKRERHQNLTVRRRFRAIKVKVGPGTRRGLEALGYFGDH